MTTIHCPYEGCNWHFTGRGEKGTRKHILFEYAQHLFENHDILEPSGYIYR